MTKFHVLLHKTMSKILFIADHLHGGGAEQVMLDVANNLAKKHCVTIALLDSSNIRMNISNKVNQVNLDIHEHFMTGNLWKRKGRHLTSDEISKIQNLVSTINPDLIILSHWYAFYIQPFITGNIWSWIHGEIFDPIKKDTNNPFRWYKEKRRLHFEITYFTKLFRNQNIIFVNNHLKEISQPYIPNSNIRTIYNCIDYNRLSQNLAFSQEKKWDCIYVGRLSEEKQPSHAILAFAKSSLTGRLAIVGDGLELDSLIKLTEKLNITNRVDFLGWKSDVANYIKQSSLLILTSIKEGCPLIIAESLLLDTPVVTYECSEGISYQLSSGELSRGLVSPQNIDSLALTISNIFKAPYKITTSDKEKLSINHMIEDFESLLVTETHL